MANLPLSSFFMQLIINIIIIIMLYMQLNLYMSNYYITLGVDSIGKHLLVVCSLAPRFKVRIILLINNL